MKKKYETCETCKYREGTKCRKLGEYVCLDDFCGHHKKVKKEKAAA